MTEARRPPAANPKAANPKAANDDALAVGTAPAAAIEGLIRLCRDLSTLIRKETTRLKDMKTLGLSEMQAEKSSLAALYDDRARLVMSDTATLKAVPDDLRIKLRNALQELHAAMAENECALLAVRSANERVIRTVVDTVAARNQKIPVYGRDGVARDASAGREPARLSLTVDRQL